MTAGWNRPKAFAVKPLSTAETHDSSHWFEDPSFSALLQWESTAQVFYERVLKVLPWWWQVIFTLLHMVAYTGVEMHLPGPKRGRTPL